jgi:hypothetical protein
MANLKKLVSDEQPSQKRARLTRAAANPEVTTIMMRCRLEICKGGSYA